MDTFITELVNYGIENGLIDELDRIYTTNRLIELMGLSEYTAPSEAPSPRALTLHSPTMMSAQCVSSPRLNNREGE